MKTLPARVRWAVHLLDPRPEDQILEVGGGSGLAAALICERLTAGRLLMIDRSAVAVGRAAQRNAIHLASGRLVVAQSALAALTVPPRSFDKALTINVNLFWATSPARELTVLRQALRPGGVLHVVYGAGGPTAPERIAKPVAAALREHGFTGISVTTAPAGFAITGRGATGVVPRQHRPGPLTVGRLTRSTALGDAVTAISRAAGPGSRGGMLNAV